MFLQQYFYTRNVLKKVRVHCCYPGPPVRLSVMLYFLKLLYIVYTSELNSWSWIRGVMVFCKKSFQECSCSSRGQKCVNKDFFLTGTSTPKHRESSQKYVLDIIELMNSILHIENTYATELNSFNHRA